MVQDCRILYILSGNAELYLDDCHYTLSPGSLFYCYTGNCYNLSSESLDYICLNFDLTQDNNTHTAIYPRIPVSGSLYTPPEPAANSVSSTENNPLFSHLVLANAMEYLNELNKILKEFSTQKIYYTEACSGILKTLLITLYRNSLRTTDSSIDAVDRVLQYIREHYDRPITNKMLSEATDYHENHLNRLFLHHAGVTIHRYLLTFRINEAKKLLLNSSLPLHTIAEKTGFNSNTYFSYYFKQAEGMSPLEYRKKFQNKI